jgi:hypothetical protein
MTLIISTRSSALLLVLVTKVGGEDDVCLW